MSSLNPTILPAVRPEISHYSSRGMTITSKVMESPDCYFRGNKTGPAYV